MKRDDLLRRLEDDVATKLAEAAVCESPEALALNPNLAGMTYVAGMYRARAQHLRWSAGCGMALINHVNGVSPE
jgi:hypothetical protein